MMDEFSYDGNLKQASEILALLKKGKEKPLSSRDIAGALNINRQNVYDSIAYLRSCGYEIEANRKEGYTLKSSPENLSPVEITAELKCRRFGSRIYSYKSVGSTNSVAQDLAKSGYPEGTLVVADKQTKGKGRLGRKWHSPPGKGLYFSLVLKPDMPPDRMAGLSLVAGLSVVRAVFNAAGITTQTKWPNDVLYKGKKLAGILVELAAELDRIDYMVLGCGVNVNHQKRDFPLNLQIKSTSLKIITRHDISRIRLLQEILRQFEDLYDNFCKHGLKYLSGELIKNSAVIGKRVAIAVGKKKFSGKAVSFDNTGGLVIKSKSGLVSYPAGEVSLR